MSVLQTAPSPPALSIRFTIRAMFNTSSTRTSPRTQALPLMNDPLSVPFLYLPSFITLKIWTESAKQTAGERKRARQREKEYSDLKNTFHSLYIQPLTFTWTYIGKHQHMIMLSHRITLHTLSFLHYHPPTHTVLIAPCEGHREPLITRMGSFKSGRRTQCCSCRMERN